MEDVDEVDEVLEVDDVEDVELVVEEPEDELLLDELEEVAETQ